MLCSVKDVYRSNKPFDVCGMHHVPKCYIDNRVLYGWSHYQFLNMNAKEKSHNSQH